MEVEFKLINSFVAMSNSYNLINLMYEDLSKNDYEKMLSEMINKGYSQIQVFNENEVIGVAGLWENTKLWCGKYIELDNVILSPSYRSFGIGERLIYFVENYAKNNNVNLLVCDAYNDNYKAIKFYYNQGFIGRGTHFIKKI